MCRARVLFTTATTTQTPLPILERSEAAARTVLTNHTHKELPQINRVKMLLDEPPNDVSIAYDIDATSTLNSFSTAHPQMHAVFSYRPRQALIVENTRLDRHSTVITNT